MSQERRVWVARWLAHAALGGAQGNLLWSRVWGTGEDSGGGLAIDPGSGEIYLSGETLFNGSDIDAFVLKFDPAGQLLWSRAWGGPGDDAFGIRFHAGELYAAGYTDGCCGIQGDCAGSLTSPVAAVAAPSGSAANASGSGAQIVGTSTSPSDVQGCGGLEALFLKFNDCGPTARTPFCFGDGNGAACPCSNPGGPGAGCAHSGGNGATLDGSGTNSVAAGNLLLEATSAVPDRPGLFLQGNNAIDGGCGVPFGDGLRCAGGGVVRLQVVVSDPAGDASTSVNIAGAGGAAPGAVLRYQYWYRDPLGSPCGSAFNLTNGLEIVWLP